MHAVITCSGVCLKKFIHLFPDHDQLFTPIGGAFGLRHPRQWYRRTEAKLLQIASERIDRLTLVNHTGCLRARHVLKREAHKTDHVEVLQRATGRIRSYYPDTAIEAYLLDEKRRVLEFIEVVNGVMMFSH
ncbi:MAG TPA: hypothetical protein VJC05_02365 [Candidatus Andersenbacteria bacterium]|nr:hypothetical protein [Candidatus Andersenbacteria bacterium]